MRNAMVSTLLALAEKNEKMCFLTGDLGFGAFEPFEESFKDRYFNVGVCEQNMIGTASGLALTGMLPFTYSIATFATLRCFEQIRNNAAYHNLNINMIGFGAGFAYGAAGATHHCTEDLALMMSLHNVQILTPCTESQVKSAMQEATEYNGPTYIRLEKKTLDNALFKTPTVSGKISRIHDGSDVTIFTCGAIANEALLAAQNLKKEGISVRVECVLSLRPFDLATLSSSIKETQGVIVLEEHIKDGGLGSLIASLCLENALHPKFFKRMAIENQFSKKIGSQDYLRKANKLNSTSITDNIVKLLKS